MFNTLNNNEKILQNLKSKIQSKIIIPRNTTKNHISSICFKDGR